MEHDPEISAELRRLADAHRPDPVDIDTVLTRGRHSLHRRRYLSAGGALAGVAAVALTASLLPGFTSGGQSPAAAGSKADFSPVPGVPRGEAGADQRISKTEAQRRCALRVPDVKGPLQADGPFRSGWVAVYGTPGTVSSNITCTVPGGDRPSPRLVEAAAKDPVPTSTEDKLRNCSVAAWVDVTDWRVVASDQFDGGPAILVAISPSGTKLVECGLTHHPAQAQNRRAETIFLTLHKLTANDPVVGPASGREYRDLFAGFTGFGACSDRSCGERVGVGGWGRVSTAATKVVLELGSKTVHEVPVQKDGWFAYMWDARAGARPKVTAYDQNGKVVKRFVR